MALLARGAGRRLGPRARRSGRKRLVGGLFSGTRLTLHAIADVLASLSGRSPHYVNACGKSGELALMTAAGAADGYLHLLRLRRSSPIRRLRISRPITFV